MFTTNLESVTIMKDYENMQKAVRAFEDIDDPRYRKLALVKMLHDGTIDMLSAISAFGTYLEEFKDNAIHDTHILSQCGLDLGEKQIKKIHQIKDDSKRQLAIAQANTLLSGGGYHSTKYGNELRTHIDMSEVDEKWYDKSWALRNPIIKEDAAKNDVSSDI